MRQNNVDFHNKDLPTNILALLLAGEQRARQVNTQDGWRDPDASDPPRPTSRTA